MNHGERYMKSMMGTPLIMLYGWIKRDLVKSQKLCIRYVLQG